MYMFFRSRLVNWSSACVQSFNFTGIVVAASDVMAGLGKAGAGNKADISRADDRNIHKLLFLANGRECYANLSSSRSILAGAARVKVEIKAQLWKCFQSKR